MQIFAAGSHCSRHTSPARSRAQRTGREGSIIGAGSARQIAGRPIASAANAAMTDFMATAAAAMAEPLPRERGDARLSLLHRAVRRHVWLARNAHVVWIRSAVTRSLPALATILSGTCVPVGASHTVSAIAPAW